MHLLEEQGLAERTVLVVYGDHEGASRAHYDDIWKLLGQARPQDDQLALVSLQTIPLFIRVPGVVPQGEMERVGGQIDILPTLANIMGLRKGFFVGEDLFGARENPTPLSGRVPHGSFVDDETLYVAPAGDQDASRYYERRTQVPLDPQLAQEKLERVLRMHEYSQTIIRHDLIPRLMEGVAAEAEDSVRREQVSIGDEAS